MIEAEIERRELRLRVDVKLYDEIYDFINVNGIIDQSCVTYGNTDKIRSSFLELTVPLLNVKWQWKDLIESLSDKDNNKEFLSDFISSNIDYYNDERGFCTTFVVFRYKVGQENG